MRAHTHLDTRRPPPSTLFSRRGFLSSVLEKVSPAHLLNDSNQSPSRAAAHALLPFSGTAAQRAAARFLVGYPASVMNHLFSRTRVAFATTFSLAPAHLPRLLFRPPAAARQPEQQQQRCAGRLWRRPAYDHASCQAQAGWLQHPHDRVRLGRVCAPPLSCGARVKSYLTLFFSHSQ